MPIRLEQPQPFIPGISAGYGATDQMTRNNPVIVSAADNTARTTLAARAQAQAEAERRQRAALAAQELMQRQSAQNYQNLQSGMESQARFDLGQEQIGADRQGRSDSMSFQAARDQFQAAAEERQLVKRAEVQNWLAQQEVDHKERGELRRMQSAVTEVEGIKGLTREGKDDMILAIRTGIDPLQQRLKASQAKAMEQQTTAMAKQQELLTTLQTGTQAEITAAIAKFTIPFRNPHTGQMEPFYATPDGELKPIPFQGKAEKAGKLTDELGRGVNDYTKDRATAVKAVDEWAKVRDQERAAEGSPPLTAAEKAANVEADLEKVYGWKPGGVSANFGRQQQRQSGQAPPPKPFDATKPETMSDGQRVAVRQMEAGVRDVQRRTDLPAGRQERILAMADAMLDMLQVWGSVEGIRDPEEKKRYVRFEKALAEVPPPPKQSGPPPTLRTAEAEGRAFPIPLHGPAQRPAWLDRYGTGGQPTPGG